MPKNEATPKNKAQSMAHGKPEKKSGAVTPLPGPVAQGKQGCTPSFLNQKKDEMDKTCGITPQQKKEEYVQPESEKESGGEG
jgi:hypothetical protein